MKYFVSRQIYWMEGQHAVEVSAGGTDYCGPDALVAKFPGEMQEYASPSEAMKVAVEIRAAWAKEQPDETIYLTYGHNLDMCGPDMDEDSPCNPEEALDWAKREEDRLPKCDRCGDLLGDEKYQLTDLEERFCSENCANRYYEELMKEFGSEEVQTEGGEEA